MITINLNQLAINPDDKKKIKAIKNRFTAAVLVFLTLVIINTFIKKS